MLPNYSNYRWHLRSRRTSTSDLTTNRMLLRSKKPFFNYEIFKIRTSHICVHTIGIGRDDLPDTSGLLNQFIYKELSELLMRIELTTSSLPRKCSTPELQQLVIVSGHCSKVNKTTNNLMTNVLMTNDLNS